VKTHHIFFFNAADKVIEAARNQQLAVGLETDAININNLRKIISAAARPELKRRVESRVGI